MYNEIKKKVCVCVVLEILFPFFVSFTYVNAYLYTILCIGFLVD